MSSEYIVHEVSPSSWSWSWLSCTVKGLCGKKIPRDTTSRTSDRVDCKGCLKVIAKGKR